MKRNTLSIIITLICATSVFGAAAYNGSKLNESNTGKPAESKEQPSSPAGKAEMKQTLQALQTVAVQETSAGSYEAEVIGYGEAHSRYELTYTSEVSGRVLSISDTFATGQVVTKGEVLARVDDTGYQQALTQAKANLAQAKLDLLEEQRQGVQAKLEWERSGLKGEPDSPLVLRQPQLENAQANLANAELELKKAQQDADNTVVRAPFNALVVSRDIQPGSYVQAGSELATLYSIDRVEIDIPLSDVEWSKLASRENAFTQQTSWPVTLVSPDSSYQWQGYVTRTEKHLSQDTRQRSLVVAVDNPLEQERSLYPGTFVQASISGDKIGLLWELPDSAVSQQGEIWTVSEEGTLVKSEANVSFARQGKVYVSPVQGLEVAQVVKRPLSSFQNNMRVNPVSDSQNAGEGHE